MEDEREQFRAKMRALVLKGVSLKTVRDGLEQRARAAKDQEINAWLDQDAPKKATWEPKSSDQIRGEVKQGIIDRYRKDSKGGALGAFVDRVGHVGTLGAADLLRRKTIESDELGQELRRARQENVAENPKAALAGTVAGGVLSPANWVGGAAAAPVASGLGKAVTAGAVSGAVQGGAQAAFEGKDLKDVAVDTGIGGLAGGVTGAAVHAGGKVLGAGRDLLRKNKWIGARAKASDAGVYKRPDMVDLPSGKEGQEEVAKRSFDKIVARDRELGREASAAYHEAVGPHLGSRVEKERLVGDLSSRRLENLDPDSGLPLRENVDRAYARAIEKTPDAPTVEGTLARRRALKADAAFDSMAPSPEQDAARDVYGAFRGAVRRASPEVAAADDAYSAFAETAKRRGDILFNTEAEVIPGAGAELGPVRGVEYAADDLLSGAPVTAADEVAAAAPRVRVGKERAAVTFLKRAGDDNDPGLRAQRYIQELAAQDPAFAQAIDDIVAKKALEATRLSLTPLMPTSLTGAAEAGGKGAIVRQNLRALGYGAERLLNQGQKASGEVAERIGPVMTEGERKYRDDLRKKREHGLKARDAMKGKAK